jgi:hypothetical protein
MSDHKLEKLWQEIEIARRKDLIEIEIEKKKFAESVKNSVGKKINDFNSYIKPEPSFFTKLKTKILRIFKYI